MRLSCATLCTAISVIDFTSSHKPLLGLLDTMNHTPDSILLNLSINPVPSYLMFDVGSPPDAALVWPSPRRGWSREAD